MLHDSWVNLVAASIGHSSYILEEQTMDYRQHENNSAGGDHNRSFSARAKRAFNLINMNFIQADELYKRYSDQMPDNTKKDLENFLEIASKKNPISRGISFMLKGYLRSDLPHDLVLFGGHRLQR